MNIRIPYGTSGINFELPDENIWQILFPYLEKPLPDLEQTLVKSFDNPIGTVSLRQLINRKGKPHDLRISLLCDDYTRPTPQKQILNALIPYLTDLGILPANIRVVIATSSHRKMSRQEIYSRFGSWMTPILIENHNVDDNLINIGKNSLGQDLMINRFVVDSDIRISAGSVAPHPVMGFYGGSKMLVPGVAGRDTIYNYHKIFAQQTNFAPGDLENPLRTFSDEAAERLGLDFVVNLAMNTSDSVCGVFSGHYKEAFLEGARFSKKLLGVRIKPGADLVIAGAFPLGSNLWHAMKVLVNISQVPHGQGMILFIAPLREKARISHPDFIDYLSHSSGELLDMLEKGNTGDVSAASIATRIAMIREKKEIVMLSDYISDEQAEKMKVKLFRRIDEALEYCKSKMGKDLNISIIPYGGSVSPYVEKGNDDENRTNWLNM